LNIPVVLADGEYLNDSQTAGIRKYSATIVKEIFGNPETSRNILDRHGE
jgi:hypothetical protein